MDFTSEELIFKKGVFQPESFSMVPKFSLICIGFIRLPNLPINQIPANDLTLNIIKKIRFNALVFLPLILIKVIATVKIVKGLKHLPKKVKIFSLLP